MEILDFLIIFLWPLMIVMVSASLLNYIDSVLRRLRRRNQIDNFTPAQQYIYSLLKERIKYHFAMAHGLWKSNYVSIEIYGLNRLFNPFSATWSKRFAVIYFDDDKLHIQYNHDATMEGFYDVDLNNHDAVVKSIQGIIDYLQWWRIPKFVSADLGCELFEFELLDRRVQTYVRTGDAHASLTFINGYLAFTSGLFYQTATTAQVKSWMAL